MFSFSDKSHLSDQWDRPLPWQEGTCSSRRSRWWGPRRLAVQRKPEIDEYWSHQQVAAKPGAQLRLSGRWSTAAACQRCWSGPFLGCWELRCSHLSDSAPAGLPRGSGRRGWCCRSLNVPHSVPGPPSPAHCWLVDNTECAGWCRSHRLQRHNDNNTIHPHPSCTFSIWPVSRSTHGWLWSIAAGWGLKMRLAYYLLLLTSQSNLKRKYICLFCLVLENITFFYLQCRKRH